MSSLSPCPACRRHVRTESACPFCGATLGAAPERHEPPRGARRAAMLAVSAALASTTFVACGDDTTGTGGSGGGSGGQGGTAQGGDAPEGGGGQLAAGGGGAGTGGSGGDGGAGGVAEGGFGGMIAPPYGAPPV